MRLIGPVEGLRAKPKRPRGGRRIPVHPTGSPQSAAVRRKASQLGATTGTPTTWWNPAARPLGRRPEQVVVGRVRRAPADAQPARQAQAQQVPQAGVVQPDLVLDRLQAAVGPRVGHGEHQEELVPHQVTRHRRSRCDWARPEVKRIRARRPPENCRPNRDGPAGASCRGQIFSPRRDSAGPKSGGPRARPPRGPAGRAKHWYPTWSRRLARRGSNFGRLSGWLRARPRPRFPRPRLRRRPRAGRGRHRLGRGRRPVLGPLVWPVALIPAAIAVRWGWGVRHGVGADFAFLPKPFSPARLAWKVREVLDRL